MEAATSGVAAKTKQSERGAILDQVELDLISGSLDRALSNLLQVWPPGTPWTITESRFHSLIPYLSKLITNADQVRSVFAISPYFIASESHFTLIETVQILGLLQSCLQFPECVLDGLELLSSITKLFHANVMFSLSRIRRIVFPHCRSADQSVQRAALGCIVQLFETTTLKKPVNDLAEEELALLLGVIPQLIHPKMSWNLSVALQCLLSIIPFAISFVQAGATSVLLILRKSLALQIKPKPNQTSGFKGELNHDHSSSQKITVMTLSCLKSIAQYAPSVLNGFWSSFMPSSVQSALDRSPFGGPTLLTLVLFDPSSKIRALACDVLISMIEGCHLPMSVPAKAPRSAIICSTSRMYDMIDGVHGGLQRALLDVRADFAASHLLRAISSLASRVSYSAVPRSRNSLSQILKQLIFNLQSNSAFWMSLRHDLFGCLASVCGAPVDFEDALMEKCISVLLQEYKTDTGRRPPNAFTVMGRISHRHSVVLSKFWAEILPILSSTLEHSNENVQISVLALIDEWLVIKEGMLNTFLSLPHGEDLLVNQVLGCSKGFSNATSRCLVTISRISPHSWMTEVTESARTNLCNFVQKILFDPALPTASGRFRSVVLRAVGTLGSHDPESEFTVEALPRVLACLNAAEPAAVRSRAIQALSDILNQPILPEKCAEVLIRHPSLVECMHTCLHDQTVGNVINAIRSVIAMLQIDTIRPSLVEKILPTLLQLSQELSANVKLQWNICRALGIILAFDSSYSIEILDFLLVRASSHNDKVSISAINALQCPAVFLRHPEYIPRYTNMIRRPVSIDVKHAMHRVTVSLIQALGTAAEPIQMVLTECFENIHLDDKSLLS